MSRVATSGMTESLEERLKSALMATCKRATGYMDMQDTSSAELLVDNTAAIEVAQNVGVSAKTKHFETCIHYFRHEVQHGRIVPIHILPSFQLLMVLRKVWIERNS